LLGKSTKLNEREACRIFAALGVAQAESQVIATPEETVSIGFPVVAKVLSSDIAHKTEAGGVVLGITNAAALRTSTKEMLARVRSCHPDARIEGILVQRMAQGLAEVIVGYRRDPQVGPIVMLGIGGVLAEIYRDIALRLAPVGAGQAFDMIGEVKGLAMIRGFRKLPRGDLSALANAVSAFSQLAAIEEVLEAEINPLIVKGESEGVVAVDGLIIKSADMAQPMRAA
jgi:succinyl-CoA synthetase beta subunit